MKVQSKHKIKARFGLRMPENPYSSLLLDHIDGFEFFSIFVFKFSVIFPYLTKGQLPSSRHSAVVIIAPDLYICF